MNREIPKDFYITSDTWFGRPQILQIANRSSFNSIDEMDEVLVRNWNKKVKMKDVVFHLGNFAWDPITARKVLKKLNGTIFFVRGSQDKALEEVIGEFPRATFLEDSITDLVDFDVVLSHYPLRVWNGKDSGTLHMHGHTVFSDPTNLKLENRFNMCTDYWNYTPINYLTLKDFIDA